MTKKQTLQTEEVKVKVKVKRLTRPFATNYEINRAWFNVCTNTI